MKLKEIIKIVTGMAVQHQRLIYNGEHLCDSSTLADYKIKDGSTIDLCHMLGPKCTLGCKN